MAALPKGVAPKVPLPKPRTNLKKSDYVYALEVVSQPAKTAAEKAIKRQAKADIKYLEKKFPDYTAKKKTMEGRTSSAQPKVLPVGNTKIGTMSNSRFAARAE